jgi:hypothetical protein
MKHVLYVDRVKPGRRGRMRAVRGDEKGSLKSETVKYGEESQGTRTRERLRWRGPEVYTENRLFFSSETAPQKIKTVTVKE